MSVRLSQRYLSHTPHGWALHVGVRPPWGTARGDGHCRMWSHLQLRSKSTSEFPNRYRHTHTSQHIRRPKRTHTHTHTDRHRHRQAGRAEHQSRNARSQKKKAELEHLILLLKETTVGKRRGLMYVCMCKVRCIYSIFHYGRWLCSQVHPGLCSEKRTAEEIAVVCTQQLLLIPLQVRNMIIQLKRELLSHLTASQGRNGVWYITLGLWPLN